MNTIITHNISNYFDAYNKYILINLKFTSNKVININTHIKIHNVDDNKYTGFFYWIKFYITQLYGMTIGEYNKFVYNGDGYYKNDTLYIYIEDDKYYITVNKETIEVNNNFIFNLIDKLEEICNEIKKDGLY